MFFLFVFLRSTLHSDREDSSDPTLEKNVVPDYFQPLNHITSFQQFKNLERKRRGSDRIQCSNTAIIFYSGAQTHLLGIHNMKETRHSTVLLTTITKMYNVLLSSFPTVRMDRE